MYLVIVESPAKAKTINKYLGAEYHVIASMGHVRALPSKSSSVVPSEDFAMLYQNLEKSQRYITEIIKQSKKAKTIYLATDPDREGEAISWHITEIIKENLSKIPENFFHRVSFTEITKKAVVYAVQNPRALDLDLINAQQARVALDYLVGFTLSPLLWRKLPGCKSAGRVQSPALRLICEREDEIERFKKEEYWDVKLALHNANNQKVVAKLTAVNQVKLEKFSYTSQEQIAPVVEKLNNKCFIVDNIEKKQQKRQPPSPFITSSMQQEAARKLNFSAKKTMQIAQKLYEGVEIDGESAGLITYMRTDGTNIEADAVQAIRKFIVDNIGQQYLPSSPRVYKSKAKNAQEAHEAIRPTNINLRPKDVERYLDKDGLRLYELIWKRTIACQMENVLLDMVSVSLESVCPITGSMKEFSARANGCTIAFDGFYKIYQEGIDDEDENEDEAKLPKLELKEQLECDKIIPAQHFTEPPPRYSESSLVKKLEELGIGRPSTYAPILSVLQDRKYVILDKKRLLPSELGRILAVFLAGFFQKYVQYEFTADLEEQLDQVSQGNLMWKTLLANFWQDFNLAVHSAKELSIQEVVQYIENKLDYHYFKGQEELKICPKCKGSVQLKLGKFSAFLGCSNYPNCDFVKNITAANDNAEQKFEQIEESGSKEKLLYVDEANNNIYLKNGPYGWYLQIGEVVKGKKAKCISVPSNINPMDLTKEQAQKIASIPFILCEYEQKTVIIGIGRYGPYIKYDNSFISIPKKYNMIELKEDEAIALIKAHSAKKNTEKNK
ncbi:DNA topoisomerase 1 [Rickettsiales endosymbiont of Paramecium tredecaurelia]|uniref:type I DNA topoisomerase n=1 Tax=Candidatus Sarmatiella mevalonica TaxID=2770581 RepID=UPI001920A074|nr:type I DNA topoisomerase [Candidatus Sarmatiella mevalonica]MBL3284930.1 DNA topoisomerase 1 [Candidatus Sarmatiella mevalonica]